jgi:hypothetical protein
MLRYVSHTFRAADVTVNHLLAQLFHLVKCTSNIPHSWSQ